MKTMALALVALLLSGCPVKPHYIYRAGITTPATAEGHECRRQCLGMIGACGNYLRDSKPVFVEAGPYSARYGCPAIVSDCMVLCPGAKEDPRAGPALFYVDEHGSVRKVK